MDPTARFAELVSAGCEPLDETALAIAAHAHPVDVAAQLDRLDALAAEVPAHDAAGLCHHLFGDLGFRGNRSQYYDPANSFLDVVVDRRLGIPITLSVLAMEVGRRRGIGLAGIGMPGHFLVREVGGAGRFFDPFGGGAVLDRDGCAARFGASHEGAPFHDEYLRPVDAVDIAARMLLNLTAIALRGGDDAMLDWVLGLRLLLPGCDPAVASQRARLHAPHN